MKIKFYLFAFLICSGFVRAQAPPWLWAEEAFSSASEYAWDVSCDTNSNNIYVGGTFAGDISSKYGATLSSTYGQNDGFLAKYTIGGIFQWAIKVGGTTMDEVRSVSVDPSGNIYICGYFTGTADFDPTATTFNLTSSGAKDGFLAKYSASGVFIWAVKYGGSGDEEPWKMYADANGVYLTGYYTNSPATFYSFSSGITKVSTSTNSNGEAFGAKYSFSGVAQWVISGGSNKIDCGFNVVADANNAYFIGRYDADITFKNSAGVASALLPAQQNNKQQVFIVTYTQAGGNFVWQNNITCATSNDVGGWTINQDAANLYVSGYLEDDINFSFPSITLTQTHTGGGSTDLFLAKLSKGGVFTWRAAVTGSTGGDQIGRAIEVDRKGNVVLSGTFKSTLNYSAAGGPIFTANGKDVFVSSYSNSGTFQWAAMAGTNGDEEMNGSAVDNAGGIYVAGDHDNGAVFGAYTLTDGGSDNIYVAKIGCTSITNNTVSASQTICSGTAPFALSGSLPVGSGPCIYTWEKSLDNASWVNAAGTVTNQNYSSPSLTVSTYFRRKVTVIGQCANVNNSTSILISVDSSPTVSNAGSAQSVCSSTATLNGNTPTIGTGLWSVVTGTSAVTSPSVPNSGVTGLSNGLNKYIWTISNGVCPASTSTVTITRDLSPTVSNAGSAQTICSSTATLNGNAPVTGVGIWSVISGIALVSFPNNPNSVVTGISNGANQFVWTISNGSCPTSSSSVIITKDISPDVPNTGPDQFICSNIASLNANNPINGTGVWTLVTGSGTIANAGNNNTNISGLGIGFNKIIWSISNGVCPVLVDTVVIRNDDFPTIANAGINKIICGSNDTLKANRAFIGVGSWLAVSGNAIINNTSSAESTVGNLSAGNNIFVWTIVNGSCPASFDTTNIFSYVNPAAASAGADQRICSNNGILAATAPSAGAGIWTVNNGSGNFSNINQQNAQLSNIGIGNNIYVWTVTNGVCPVSSGEVTIIRDALPDAAIAGNDLTLEIPLCQLSANTPTLGVGFWSIVEGSALFASVSQPSTNVTEISTGNNIFRWSVKNGVCPDNTDDVSVYLKPLFIPNAFSPNGDNMNDKFIVLGLDFYSDVNFNVFNRWGALVYKNSNYKNDWNGFNLDNQFLTDDTYFYTLIIPSIKKDYTGFIILKTIK